MCNYITYNIHVMFWLIISHHVNTYICDQVISFPCNNDNIIFVLCHKIWNWQRLITNLPGLEIWCSLPKDFSKFLLSQKLTLNYSAFIRLCLNWQDIWLQCTAANLFVSILSWLILNGLNKLQISAVHTTNVEVI